MTPPRELRLEPVDQTTFGDPHGNCLMACVASLTGLPLDTLDDLYRAEARMPDAPWWDVFERALWRHGWHPMYVPGATGVIPQGYAIGSGMSPRNLRHAVVVYDGEVAHDPHPSRAGVHEIEHYYVLIPATTKPPASPTPDHEAPHAR